MEQNNNKEKYPPFPSLAKPIENTEMPHNIREKYYYTEPRYRNYSIHDFYENLPPSYFKSEKYKYIKSKTYDDTIFKIYMGGIAIVGLYIFYNIIEK